MCVIVVESLVSVIWFDLYSRFPPFPTLPSACARHGPCQAYGLCVRVAGLGGCLGLLAADRARARSAAGSLAIAPLVTYRGVVVTVCARARTCVYVRVRTRVCECEVVCVSVRRCVTRARARARVCVCVCVCGVGVCVCVLYARVRECEREWVGERV